MNIWIFMHHLKVQFIIQTFAHSYYEPITLYPFSLFFIFQATYLAWASPAHRFDFLSVNSKQLSFTTCINTYVQYLPSEILSPNVDKTFQKFCFWDLVASFGKTCTNFVSQFLYPLSPNFLYLIKKLNACIALSPNLHSKTHFCEKAVFFLLKVVVLLGLNPQTAQLLIQKIQGFAFDYCISNMYKNEQNLSRLFPGLA